MYESVTWTHEYAIICGVTLFTPTIFAFPPLVDRLVAPGSTFAEDGPVKMWRQIYRDI